MRILKTLIIMVMAGLLLITGCGKKEEEKSTPSETTVVFHVFSFDGTMGNRYMMHFDENQSLATLYTHDETLVLQQQSTASGAKYQSDRIMVWIKDDEVLMEVDGKRVGPCAVSELQPILAKAWLSGTEFWAVGNEPSWNLVMGRERVVLLTEMGQKTMEFEGLDKDVLDPMNPYGYYSFVNEKNQEMDIEIIEGRCTDKMSGEPFAVSVRVILEGEEMFGCGTGLF